ncbi:hypothetical protein RHGRI_023060 [Rhododendron griersonianum]|uniref:Uncharacterized protein n=1 Tax=Rhododendron griersonianum TaxID=479676 RepID=A0AAV6J5H0_9ERIC|nr:hypothetical protein RHGRI_023060 [Rhododendron griersonianum]
MTGEEVVGPAGPKLVRLLYFVGAGCNDLLPLLLPYASTIDQFVLIVDRKRSLLSWKIGLGTAPLSGVVNQSLHCLDPIPSSGDDPPEHMSFRVLSPSDVIFAFPSKMYQLERLVHCLMISVLFLCRHCSF